MHRPPRGLSRRPHRRALPAERGRHAHDRRQAVGARRVRVPRVRPAPRVQLHRARLPLPRARGHAPAAPRTCHLQRHAHNKRKAPRPPTTQAHRPPHDAPHRIGAAHGARRACRRESTPRRPPPHTPSRRAPSTPLHALSRRTRTGRDAGQGGDGAHAGDARTVLPAAGQAGEGRGARASGDHARAAAGLRCRRRARGRRADGRAEPVDARAGMLPRARAI
eukprot:5225905-Prymnesium_polylepis.1